MKRNELNELVQAYLDNGGVIKNCPEGRAEGIWTCGSALRPVPVSERTGGGSKIPKPKRDDSTPRELTGKI